MKQTYEQAIVQVFKDEGGYTNEATDPGGPTNWGITIHDARIYWKSNATAEDVRQMPKSIAEDIYSRHYSNNIKYDSLPAGVDYAVLDYSINSGIHKAVTAVQHIVGVTEDGIMGPITIAKISEHDPIILIKTIYTDRLNYLQTLHNWGTYKHGWTTRCNNGLVFALKLYNENKGDSMPISQNLTDTHPIHPVATDTSAPTISFPAVNLKDIDNTLQALDGYLPQVLAVVGMFYPPVAAFAKFLPLVHVAIQGVDTIAKSTGSDPATAVQTVVNHLTPGQANSSVLS